MFVRPLFLSYVCTRILTRTHAQYSTVQNSTVQYSTVQYSTVQYNTVQYSAAQYSTFQYNAVQSSAVQWSKYNTVQYVLYRQRLHWLLLSRGRQQYLHALLPQLQSEQ